MCVHILSYSYICLSNSETLAIGVVKDLQTRGDVNNNYQGVAEVIIDVTKGF